MPKLDPKTHSAMRDTAPLAAACVKAMRDGTGADDGLALDLLPVVADTALTFALVAHLTRLAVRASTPEALSFELGVTERLGRK